MQKKRKTPPAKVGVSEESVRHASHIHGMQLQMCESSARNVDMNWKGVWLVWMICVRTKDINHCGETLNWPGWWTDSVSNSRGDLRTTLEPISDKAFLKRLCMCSSISITLCDECSFTGRHPSCQGRRRDPSEESRMLWCMQQIYPRLGHLNKPYKLHVQLFLARFVV